MLEKSETGEFLSSLGDRIRPHVETRAHSNTWIGQFIHEVTHRISRAYTKELKKPGSTPPVRLQSLEAQLKTIEIFPSDLGNTPLSDKTPR